MSVSIVDDVCDIIMNSANNVHQCLRLEAAALCHGLLLGWMLGFHGGKALLSSPAFPTHRLVAVISNWCQEGYQMVGLKSTTVQLVFKYGW